MTNYCTAISNPHGGGRREEARCAWLGRLTASLRRLLQMAVFLPLFCLAESPRLAVPAASSRVVIVHDPEATDAFQVRTERIRPMISLGLTNLTHHGSVAAAWRSLISTQDIVGLKVYSGPGSTSGTRPAVVAAVIESLLESGIKRNRIILWDKSLADLKNSGFLEFRGRYGIAVEACSNAAYDPKTFYDTPLLGHLLPGDSEFSKTRNVGRKSFVSKLVTSRMTKIINITPLLNHNTAGVCGNLYSLAIGSVDNTFRFETDYDRLAEAVPEIYALPAVGDRVVLNIVDALICQYQGEQTMLLHYSTPLNELRFSKDPVALDVLSLRELERQRQAAGMLVRTNSLRLFDNASLLQLGTSDVANIQIEPVR